MKKLKTKLIIALAVVLLFVGTLCTTMSCSTETPKNDDPNYSNGITDGGTTEGVGHGLYDDGANSGDGKLQRHGQSNEQQPATKEGAKFEI